MINAVEGPDDPSKEVDCLIYVEHGSMNRPGKCEQVTNFSKLKLGDKCHVQLGKTYILKLPPIAFQKDAFYWRPKRLATGSLSLPDGVRYNSIPIGHNKQKAKMKEFWFKN